MSHPATSTAASITSRHAANRLQGLLSQQRHLLSKRLTFEDLRTAVNWQGDRPAFDALWEYLKDKLKCDVDLTGMKIDILPAADKYDADSFPIEIYDYTTRERVALDRIQTDQGRMYVDRVVIQSEKEGSGGNGEGSNSSSAAAEPGNDNDDSLSGTIHLLSRWKYHIKQRDYSAQLKDAFERHENELGETRMKVEELEKQVRGFENAKNPPPQPSAPLSSASAAATPLSNYGISASSSSSSHISTQMYLNEQHPLSSYSLDHERVKQEFTLYKERLEKFENTLIDESQIPLSSKSFTSCTLQLKSVLHFGLNELGGGGKRYDVRRKAYKVKIEWEVKSVLQLEGNGNGSGGSGGETTG